MERRGTMQRDKIDQQNVSLFSCPVCGEPLWYGEKEYLCKNGHRSDIASEGYVHLLPPNQMHSKVPGDNKQMVMARRKFLESGFYQIFSDAMNGIIYEEVLENNHPVILDAGCGEGYYTARLSRFLKQKGISERTAGFDISKFAIKAAAKRYRKNEGIEFAVASIFQIPVREKQADCVIDVFAPIVPEEFFRVLKPGGLLLLAVPAERHLWQLKQVLYEKPYENEKKDIFYEGFTFLNRKTAQGKILIEGNEMIQNLFAMTPYYWKTPLEGCERLKKLQELTVEIAFDFLSYRRN